jgi:hypothetical protein
MKNATAKIFFGIMIFAFSLALAYFSADYFSSDAGMGAFAAGGWGLIMFGFGLLYAIAGVLLVRVLPVSLALLFSADVALLHALARNYNSIEGMYRVGMIAVVLVIVYLFAWYRCKDSMLGLEESQAKIISENVVTETPHLPGV